MKDVNELLIKSSKEGNFLQILYQVYRDLSADEKYLSELLVVLHNLGKVNVVREFDKLSKNHDAGDFFLLRRIFEIALPSLNCPVDQMMATVKHLVERAGNDLAANRILPKFSEFCKKDVNRFWEVLNISLSEIENWHDFIALALIGGAELRFDMFFSYSCDLARHQNSLVVIQAIHALGNLNYSNQQDSFDIAFEIALSHCQTENESLKAAVYRSLLHMSIGRQKYLKEVAQLINERISANDHISIHYIASEICNVKVELPAEFHAVVQDKLSLVNPENHGTLNFINIYLSSLIDSKRGLNVVRYLENVLTSNHNEYSFDNFKDSFRKFRQKDGFYLNYLATRWLLDGRVPLCHAVYRLLHDQLRDDYIVLPDVCQVINRSDQDILFLARKTVGWLFALPIVVVRFILHIMDAIKDPIISDLSKLIFNPISLSYSKTVQDYLVAERCNYSEKIKYEIDKLIDAIDNYRLNIKEAIDIKEHRIQERHISIYMEKMSNEVQDSMNEHKEDTPLLNLVTKLRMLYGERVITKLITHDDQEHRIETKLHSISTEIEIPALMMLDEVGLNLMLIGFRLEQRKR